MMQFQEGDIGVFEKDAGILKADKALACYHVSRLYDFFLLYA